MAALQPTEFIWHNGEFKSWDDAKVHVLTHTLHYGAGAFEGIRVYKTSDRGPAVFRLREHIERLFYSSRALKIEIPYSEDQVIDATLDLLQRNKMPQGYVRPIAFYGYGIMGLNPTNAPVELAIAAWPWGSYLGHDMVDIKTSSYIRIHPKST
ncbi:MAG: aminotransferase class IV, partial [Bdellovibrionales bacterium]|nr:aminotransferase class IV [Bdellovibrionales bacterium]